MKLGKIASLFKKNKRIILYTAADGTQWISNGVAIYSMRGMPPLTPEIVLRFFDVPADQLAKWQCETEDLPAGIDFSDFVENDKELELMKVNIDWYGETFMFFPDGKEIYSIQAAYVMPMIGGDYITYQKRKMAGGGHVIAVKDGLELMAIICPYDLGKSDVFVEEVDKLAALYSRN